jgi:hypothetical protein
MILYLFLSNLVRMPCSVIPPLEWFNSKQWVGFLYSLQIIVSRQGDYFKCKLYAYTEFKCVCVCVFVFVCVSKIIAVFYVFILSRNGFQMTEIRILTGEKPNFTFM